MHMDRQTDGHESKSFFSLFIRTLLKLRLDTCDSYQVPKRGYS